MQYLKLYSIELWCHWLIEQFILPGILTESLYVICLSMFWVQEHDWPVKDSIRVQLNLFHLRSYLYHTIILILIILHWLIKTYALLLQGKENLRLRSLAGFYLRRQEWQVKLSHLNSFGQLPFLLFEFSQSQLFPSLISVCLFLGKNKLTDLSSHSKNRNGLSCDAAAQEFIYQLFLCFCSKFYNFFMFRFNQQGTVTPTYGIFEMLCFRTTLDAWNITNEDLTNPLDQYLGKHMDERKREQQSPLIMAFMWSGLNLRANMQSLKADL